MPLNEFCKTLQQGAEKLEEEVRYSINEFHNLIFGKNMDETKLALERAKDYHYREILDALSEILKNVKVIVFHQNKIEWLSNDANFTASDLKRFSYVKRQVYAFSKHEEEHAFSNSEEKQSFSKSEENLAVSFKAKRDKRRTASEISIGTLESWEKYLDKKENDEIQIKENTLEVKKMVPKRTLSNARARRKFVSSTFGAFLDDGEEKVSNLDSIVENSSSNDEVEDCDMPRDIAGEISMAKEKINPTLQIDNNFEYFSNANKCSETDMEFTVSGAILGVASKTTMPDDIRLISKAQRNRTELKNNSSSNLIRDSSNNENTIPKGNGFRKDMKECDDLVGSTENIIAKEANVNKIMYNFLGDDGNHNAANSGTQYVDRVKPKIIDVIYKKKPS